MVIGLGVRVSRAGVTIKVDKVAPKVPFEIS